MSLSLAEVSELELESLIESGLDPAAAFEQVFPKGSNMPRPWDWWWWGRPEQIWRPGPETYTLALAGRGWGKTRKGGHTTNYVGMHPELCGGRVAKGPDDKRAGEGAVLGIAGRTANEVNTRMVDGDVGIMACCDPALRPKWSKSDKLLTWPTGVVGRLMTGDVPASFRGPNFGFLWADELPHWLRAAESWSAADDALRVSSPGHHPRALITSTPLGTALMIALAFKLREGAPVKAPAGTPADRVLQGFLVNPETRVIQGSSYDNFANLSARFMTRTIGKYAGTKDGEQEIDGQIRLSIPGALWTMDWIHRCGVDDVPDLDRVIVAVDPTGSDGEKIKDSDKVCECGIVGLGMIKRARKVWALGDRSLVARPSRWSDVVIEYAMEINATEIFAEDNYGGEMVSEQFEAAWLRRRSEFRDRRKPRVTLVTAHRNKAQRAALAAPAWEAGKVVHVGPTRRWIPLERQQTTYDPNRPHAKQQSDRMDAIVWGVLQLLGDGTDHARVKAYTDAEAWQRILAAGAGH